MASPVIPEQAKLFIGVIFSTEVLLQKVKDALIKKYGIIDIESMHIPFNHTGYYSEMGASLQKVFYSFKKLVPREKIVNIKLHTNKIEHTLSGKNKRRVNIDPGYLTLSNVFLASCKDFFHRAYLSKGIFLENEYRYMAKEFHFWEWTYPDYKKPEYLEFFYRVRSVYHRQLYGK